MSHFQHLNDTNYIENVDRIIIINNRVAWTRTAWFRTCSDHYYISVHGSCLIYFINPQWYLPTTQKKGIKESIAVMPGLVRISNRVFWVSRYGILYAEGARWEGRGV